MNDKRSAAYSHKLSSNAAQLLLQFDERIREFSGVEPASNAYEYLAYKTPKRQIPIVYCDRRHLNRVVRLRIPFVKITSTVDPRRLCKKGNAFPAFYKGPTSISHVMIPCDSTNRIEYVIDVIRKVFSLESSPPRPRVNQIGSSLSSDKHSRITTDLDRVYDLVEGIVNEIKRQFPPILDQSGEWKKSDVEQSASGLADAVRRLQVVIGRDSHDNGATA